jgi:CII-binding regulator of phage lambda lysogenization HflD
MGEQLIIPELAHLPLSDEALLAQIARNEEMLDEISNNITNPDGLSRENEHELMESFDKIYLDTISLTAEAEQRQLIHGFNSALEAA